MKVLTLIAHVLCYVLISIVACQCRSINYSVDNDRISKNMVFSKFRETKLHNIPLDESVLNITKCIQYVEEDNHEYLYILDELGNSIVRYELDDNKVPVKYNFNKASVGSIQGFHYCAEDSLYLFAYNSGKLSRYSLSDSHIVESKIMTYDYDNNNDTILPYPFVRTLSPITVYGNHILMSGFVAGESLRETTTNRPVMIQTSLHKSNMDKYLINYPIMYQQANWSGGITYRCPFYAMVGHNILISFPASHDIKVYNIADNSINDIYAGSRYIKTINSFPYNKNSQKFSSSKAWNWYMETPSYEGIVYDKYRDKYYRIARLPASDSQQKLKGNRKPISIIILDSSLNYEGEVLLDQQKHYIPSNCFVTKEGLCIQILTKNENAFEYETFIL